jgi:hypothetical protein
MALLDFFTQEAGQRRRAALDDLGREIGTYVPPELRGLLGLIAESTPTAAIDRASQSAVRMVEPGRTVEQRIGDLGGLLSETAGVVAPAMVAPRAGMTATRALEEMFMMPAAGVDDVARQFVADESGALRLTRGDYIGGHSAPQIEPGATLDNPTTMFGGDDIYTRNAMQYFGTGDPRMDQQSLSVIQKMRNSPAADVTIYRAVPTGAPDEIGAGDWVTLSPEYAKLHGESVLDGDYQIVKEKVKASELATEGNSIHEWGWWPSEARLNQRAPLPAPRNEAEAVAREILEMRAAGRAGDVTDELMAQADPQYMFANTPLPMDYESRMRRAITQGFDVNDEMYRGDAPRQSFETGRGQRDQIGVTMSTRPDVAASYIPPRGEGGIYPLVTRGLNDASIEAGGQNWNVIAPDTPVFFQGEQSLLSDYIPVGDYFEPYDIKAGTAFFDTNDLSRLYQGYGADRVRFNDLVDRGASAKYYGPESAMPSDVQMVADPANVRSRFARFDPEFRHLRNLSAGIGGLGLLATQSPEQQREDELRQYLGGLL